MDANRNLVRDALFGFAVGDALGLPAEYKSRSTLKENPVTEMQAYGTHNQPAGTWSDDSSLSFVTTETICEGYSIEGFCEKLRDMYLRNHWTPHGRLFHIETSTKNAIERLSRGVSPSDACDDENLAMGNGALMRIMPLAFYTLKESPKHRYAIVKEISSITHASCISVLACYIYTELCVQLIEGKDKQLAYSRMQKIVKDLFLSLKLGEEYLKPFSRILKGNISDLEEGDIKASSYVINSLEAVIWSFLKGDSYRKAVLTAVNLGEDTDTTAALTGALAAIHYGGDTIPANWISVLARKDEIENLASRYQEYVFS